MASNVSGGIGNLAKRIYERIVGTPAEKGQVAAAYAQLLGGKGFEQVPSYELGDYAEIYTKHPYVYGTIYELAMSAARAPLRIWEPKPDGSRREITFGASYELLHYPNELLDNIFDLLEISFIWMELAGCAYWVLDTKTGYWKDPMPVEELEIWPLPANKVSTVMDENRVLQGYIFKPDSGDPVTLHPSRVTAFRYGNPQNITKGASPTQVAELSIEQDLYAMAWNKNFLKKGANPDLLIKVPDPISKEQKDQMTDTWRKAFEGVAKWPGVAVLDRGATVEKLTLSPRDSEWSSLRGINREEFLTVWGVPPTMLGLYISGVNRSVADIQRTSFWEDTMMPKLLKFQSGVTSKFIRRLNSNKKWYAEFDLSQIPALEQSRAERDARWRANIITGLCTINEYRLAVGEIPLDWGDDRWINTSSIAGAGVSSTGPQPDASRDTTATDNAGDGGKLAKCANSDGSDGSVDISEKAIIERMLGVGV